MERDNPFTVALEKLGDPDEIARSSAAGMLVCYLLCYDIPYCSSGSPREARLPPLEGRWYSCTAKDVFCLIPQGWKLF